VRPYILLIHPLYGEETRRRIFQPGIEFPISLAYLSAYLDQKGIDNKILDLRLESDPMTALREHIAVKPPSVVGITASTAGMQDAGRVAAVVKSMGKHIPTVLGGWHASALPEETLGRYPQLDYLVHGEGEVVLRRA
jgi:radical SAM superfamily enzyme YgiQ (UPF0313 family)